MPNTTILHNTFTLERHYPTSPELVYAAFSDPIRKRRWFVESGHHTIEHYSLDFTIGGAEHALFHFNPGTPVAGLACRTLTTYLELVPNQTIVFASSMTIGGRCISAALCTIELTPTPTGTNLFFTHQAAFFEGSDGPEMRQDGWRKLMDSLARELSL
jgi:uncharacterized protein YndB with AHSA1/START domain